MRKFLFVLVLLLTLFSFGCQAVTRKNQQATATAYANSFMLEAMEAAENSALALCAIDLNEGPLAYAENVCTVSTEITCRVMKGEIADSWDEIENAYSSPKMACATSTSRLLEEGVQYGMQMQNWKVNLKGMQGFTTGESDREYWLQVGEENGSWKFTRLLSDGEISLYLAIDALENEK